MSKNIYSHIALITSPEELEKVLPGLCEFVESYEPNPNDPPSMGWGGYDSTIHTPKMYKEHSKKMKGKSFATPKSRAATVLSNQTRIVSDATKKKISESNKNKIFSSEHRKKISEALKGKKRNYPKTRKPRLMTNEIRENISKGVKRAYSTKTPNQTLSKCSLSP